MFFKTRQLICGSLAVLVAGGFASIRSSDALQERVEVGSRTTHPISIALWSVREYDIWDDSIIVQVLYNRTKERTVLLLPERKQVQEKQSDDDWRIELFFSGSRGTKPKLKVQGRVRKAGVDRSKLGEAVVAAVDRLHRDGVLESNIPGIINVQKTDRKTFWINLWALPEVPDGNIAIEVTEDLKCFVKPPND